MLKIQYLLQVYNKKIVKASQGNKMMAKQYRLENGKGKIRNTLKNNVQIRDEGYETSIYYMQREFCSKI